LLFCNVSLLQLFICGLFIFHIFMRLWNLFENFTWIVMQKLPLYHIFLYIICFKIMVSNWWLNWLLFFRSTSGNFYFTLSRIVYFFLLSLHTFNCRYNSFLINILLEWQFRCFIHIFFLLLNLNIIFFWKFQSRFWIC
jgi:hypothetical protein